MQSDSIARQHSNTAGPQRDFAIGGGSPVRRIGFGALHTTGPHGWGAPRDVASAIRTLHRLAELSVQLVDTADSYGPEISERFIRDTLYPYQGLLIATKGGLVRNSPHTIAACGRPEFLRRQIIASARRLGVERIDLWQLHRVDPSVPRDEQFHAVACAQREGLIRYAGLSEVDTETIEAAQKFFDVATVQNAYNISYRHSEEVLVYCEQHDIGFMPWGPLASGELVRAEGLIRRIAATKQATPAQIALSWLLHRSPNILPIPGTSCVQHLEENVAAGLLLLSENEFRQLSDASSGPAKAD